MNLPVINKTPDVFKKWRAGVFRAVDEIRSENSFDALVTFGAPMSDHLIGLKLKAQLRIPWIAHFSDPWVDNPFTSSDPLTNAINRSFERKVLATADRVVFTSHETIDLVFAKYPASWKERARVVPHAFDPELFGDIQPPAGDKITIRYLGDFYGPRTPEPLVKALQEMVRTEPAALENVQFELVGNVQKTGFKVTEFPSAFADLVLLKSPVSYGKSVKMMSESDALLVIDAPADRSVFLPSKLIDYIGSQRPIFGITPPGTAASLITELGGWVANPSDPAAVYQQLRALISYLRERRGQHSSGWGNDEVRNRFEVSNVAQTFTEIVREVATGAR
jgi:glycosyltransferase involved in cell wall biosynthesis